MNPRELTDTKLLQELVVKLLNEVGELKEQLARTQQQLQEAHDEIKRLKREKSRPRFKGSKGKRTIKQLSKSQESSESSPDSASTVDPIEIDRVEEVDTKPAELPSDAQFKGYRRVIQRDIRILRENVEYRISRWYSPSTGKVYEGVMPNSYRGQIGSRLRSFIQMLHHCGDMTHDRIADLLNHIGIDLSRGSISNSLTHSEWIIAEQQALLASSIASSPYVQIDATQSKEKGKRMHTQVICGEYFSLFYTLAGKSRLNVYAALQGQSRDTVQLAYTEHGRQCLEAAKVSKKHLAYFSENYSLGQCISMQQLTALFEAEPLFAKTNSIRRSVIAGALAAGYYHQQQDIPTVSSLMSDDAKEYHKIASEVHAHCWIHAIRHYRIMNPMIDYHKQIYEKFIEQLWNFYNRLRIYKTLSKSEQQKEKTRIEDHFDKLFQTQTDYNLLNKQLAVTRKNRPYLLAVLEYPELPLHNNAAERGARRVVRKRDISYHTWSRRGTRIRDAFMSLHQTANKLGVSFMNYLVDRNSGTYDIKSLAAQVKMVYDG